jgi:nucleoside 2-deoxyribosyltransferase
MEAGKTGKVRMENNFDIHDDYSFKCTLTRAMNNAVTLAQTGVSCVKSKKMYFAGPWFDERSMKLYDALEEVENICRNYSQYEVFFPRKQVNEKPLDAFMKNVENIANADVVVALVSRKDCGTSWEIGMAYSLNKRVILLGYDDTTFLSHTNVMLAFTGDCATIDEFANILCDLKFSKVKINNEWEGIE